MTKLNGGAMQFIPEEISFEKKEKRGRSVEKPISFWLEPEDKEKYDLIQETSGGELRHMLHNTIIEIIRKSKVSEG